MPGKALKLSQNQKDFIKLKSAKYQDIKNFSDKIGFTIGRKKQVLEIAVKNFKIKSKNETSKNKFERA